MASNLRTIYNSTDGPLFVDRAGHIVGGREYRDGVDVSITPPKTYVADGRMVIIEAAPAPASTTTAKA